MSPFVAFLLIVALGQFLVMQQRGIDISVAGVVSLAAVLTTSISRNYDSAVGIALCASPAIAAGTFSGFLNGVLIQRFAMPPLVVTVAGNSVLFGFVVWISGGVPATAPPLLETFCIGRTLGVPNVLVVAAGLMIVLLIIERKMLAGARARAVGISQDAARLIGISVPTYMIGAYAFAGMLYAVAGVILAGFVHVPTIYIGNDYLLASVAAVVLGSRLVGSARESILSTCVGAIFLVYVGQLVNALGLPTSVQLIIQSGILLIGVTSGGALAPALRKLKPFSVSNVGQSRYDHAG